MADPATNPDQTADDESNEPQMATAQLSNIKQNNSLSMWGNKDTMNLNHLVLENILQSPYFRNKLQTLKTFHEIVDEIYYNVTHLEPWEKGTRKTTGQTGMCGGVRGVGAGGVVSTPFCILYRLFTMKLTRKQLGALINHTDSPYIRGLGFMYIRFCQPPVSFWDWYEPYLEDEEEIDPKAGTGDTMTIGQMCKIFLTKLEWYATLFPRIPVPVQKELDVKMREHNKKIYAESKPNANVAVVVEEQQKISRTDERGRSPDRSRSTAEGRNEHRRNVEQRTESGARRRSSKSPSSSRRRHTPSNSRKRGCSRSRSRSKDRQRKKSGDRHRSSRREGTDRKENDEADDEKRRHHKKSHKHHHHRRHHHRRHRSKSTSSSAVKQDKKRRGESENQGSSGENDVAEKKKPVEDSDHNESREEGELMDEGKN